MENSLPIPAQPSYIRAALQAGKHVLSEKPIAGDLSTARALLSEYQALATKPLWGVAENWRFLGKFTRVAEEVRKLGNVKAFRVSVRTLIGEGSKYHRTFIYYFLLLLLSLFGLGLVVGKGVGKLILSQKPNGVANPRTRVDSSSMEESTPLLD